MSSRAGKPKVRTGCITCKIRRVKCDETKPECNRCLKFGASCDGYIVPTKRRRRDQGVSEEKELLPWTGPKSSGSPHEFRFFGPLSRQLAPGILFRDGMDQLYFQSFRDDVIPEIAGFQGASLCKKILQACHDEPWVIDATVAISALRMSIKARKRPTKSEEGSTSHKQHYEFALERYDQSIRAMKATLTNEERHLRKALIGCLLIFCFEGFQGHQKLALEHVISGHELLQKWLIENSFPLLRSGDTVHTSTVIEEELIDAFDRLYLQAFTSISKARISLSHRVEMMLGDQIMNEMPKAFRTLQEARRYMMLLMRRIAGFIEKAGSEATALTPWAKEFQDDELTNREDIYGVEFGTIIHRPFPPGAVPQTVIAEYEKYSAEHTRWQESFRAIWLSPVQSANVGAILGQVGSKVVRMLLEAVILTEESGFDRYEQTFRAIVSLVKSFIKSMGKSSNPLEKFPFSMDFGILPGLYLACSFCRDGRLRREAISLMSWAPCHEGVLNSALISRISTWLMEMEEASMVDGFIPESARVRVARVEANLTKKAASVKYVRAGKLESTVVTW